MIWFFFAGFFIAGACFGAGIVLVRDRSEIEE